MNTKKRSAAQKKRASAWMRSYWKNLRENDPRRYEQIKAQRRATWAAKRAQRVPVEMRRKAIDVNVLETGKEIGE